MGLDEIRRSLQICSAHVTAESATRVDAGLAVDAEEVDLHRLWADEQRFGDALGPLTTLNLPSLPSANDRETPDSVALWAT